MLLKKMLEKSEVNQARWPHVIKWNEIQLAPKVVCHMTVQNVIFFTSTSSLSPRFFLYYTYMFFFCFVFFFGQAVRTHAGQIKLAWEWMNSPRRMQILKRHNVVFSRLLPMNAFKWHQLVLSPTLSGFSLWPQEIDFSTTWLLLLFPILTMYVELFMCWSFVMSVPSLQLFLPFPSSQRTTNVSHFVFCPRKKINKNTSSWSITASVKA